MLKVFCLWVESPSSIVPVTLGNYLILLHYLPYRLIARMNWANICRVLGRIADTFESTMWVFYIIITFILIFLFIACLTV
jgi:hypothetical protein